MPPQPITEETKIAVMIEFFDNPNQTIKVIAAKFKLSTAYVSKFISQLLKMSEKERQILFQNHRIMQHD